jgi:RNA polymerase sigma factor (sigma-70 family)
LLKTPLHRDYIMPNVPQPEPVNSFPALIAGAREGCCEAKGHLLLMCADHLPAAAGALIARKSLSGKTPADFVQDSLVKALECFEQFPGSKEGEFRGWLRSILHNAIGDHLRAVGRQKRAPGQQSSIDAESPTNPAKNLRVLTPSGLDEQIRREESGLIRECLGYLDQTPRLVFYMRAVENLGFQEIGAALEMSAGAARQHYVRAAKKLAELLKKCGLDHHD